MHRILRGTTLVFIKKVDIFFYIFEILEFFDKYFKKCATNVKNLFSEMPWEVVWWVHMEIHGSE